MIYLLDASAMIAYLRNEQGAQVVEEALTAPDSQCFAHAVNLCEVFYDFFRTAGEAEAVSAVADLLAAGITQREDLMETSGRRQADSKVLIATFPSPIAAV